MKQQWRVWDDHKLGLCIARGNNCIAFLGAENYKEAAKMIVKAHNSAVRGESDIPINSVELIQRARDADFTKQDWMYDALLDHLNDYWRGYFECYLGELGNSLSSNSQTYKEELLSRMWDCWQ